MSHKREEIRRLTPRECARLQGFEDSFVIPVSDSQAYKQFGNAVTVNVSRAVAQSVKEYIYKSWRVGRLIWNTKTINVSLLRL
ncbi:MAG: DNA cytosine methyltransferase [Ruminococcus sp.]